MHLNKQEQVVVSQAAMIVHQLSKIAVVIAELTDN